MTQPEALRLADALDERVVPRWVHATGETPRQSGYAPDLDCVKAAAELRRLHQLALNQQGEIYGLQMARSMEQKTAALKAEELRRLHAENEGLRQIVEDFPPVEAELREVSDRAHRLERQRDALLEALNVVLDDLMYQDHQRVIDVARAAIAAAEGEKT